MITYGKNTCVQIFSCSPGKNLQTRNSPDTVYDTAYKICKFLGKENNMFIIYYENFEKIIRIGINFKTCIVWVNWVWKNNKTIFNDNVKLASYVFALSKSLNLCIFYVSTKKSQRSFFLGIVSFRSRFHWEYQNKNNTGQWSFPVGLFSKLKCVSYAISFSRTIKLEGITAMYIRIFTGELLFLNERCFQFWSL